MKRKKEGPGRVRENVRKGGQRVIGRKPSPAPGKKTEVKDGTGK
jgi:hypothetical protein